MWSTGFECRRPARRGLALAMLLCATPAWAEHPLHYRLAVGDRLIYERRVVASDAASDVEHGLSVREVEHRLSVCDQLQVTAFQRTGEETLVLLELQRAVDGLSEPAVGLPLYLDDSGRRRSPEEVPARLADLDAALELLPPLPLAVDTAAFWITPTDHYGRRWRCTNRGPDAQQQGHTRIEFVVEDMLGAAEVLGRECSGRFWFDTSAGLVTRLESQETCRYEGRARRVSAVLKQKLTHPPLWAARRAEEVQRFLRALRHEDRLLHELLTRPDDVEQTLTQLDRVWSAFRSDVDARAGSPLATLADARRQRWHARADALRGRAALGHRWRGQPARTWTLQHAAGQTVTSETARQGVVIECFWSAVSPWGFPVLDAMRQLQARAGDRVRVLCYNVDDDPALAAAAIARGGAGLTHLLAAPLQQTEGLPELPVVRVVDAREIVREVWIGWQADYAPVLAAAD